MKIIKLLKRKLFKKPSKKRLLALALGFIIIFGIGLFIYVKIVAGATYTWDGEGVTNDWSDCDNWTSNTCPGASDIAAFDNTSDKDATVDATHGGSVAGVDINSGYDGTITVSRSLTIGSSNFDQAAGIWNSGSQTIDINGTFTISAGTHTATSGTMTISGNVTQTGSPTFNANGGTITLDGGGASTTVNAPDVTFNLVTVNKPSSNGSTITFTISSGTELPLGDSPTFTFTQTHCCAGSAFIVNDGIMTAGTGTFTINATDGFTNNGEINVAGTAIDINGGFTQSASGEFTTGSSPTFNVSAGFSIDSSSTFPADVTLALDGAGGGTIDAQSVDFALVTMNKSTNDGSTYTITIAANNDLPLGNSATWIMEQTHCCAGSAFIVNNGTLTAGTGTLTFTTSDGFTNNGTIASSGTTIDFNGSFTQSSTGTVTSGASPTINAGAGFSIDGSSTFPSDVTLNLDGCCGGTIDAPNVDITLATVSKNTSDGGGYTLTIASGTELPLGANPTLSVNQGHCCAGSFNFTNNGTLTVGSGTLTVTADSTFTNAGTIDISAGSGFHMNGVFTQSSGATFTGTNLTINADSNFTVSSSSTFPNPGTFILDGSSGTQTLNAPGITNFGDFTKSANSTLALSHSITTDDFTRTDGTISNPGSAYTLTVQGNFSMSTTDTFGGANLTLTMSGTSAQTITQNAGTMSGVFRVDKSSNTATLTTAFITGTTCNIVEGTFDLAGYNFTCGSTFTVENGGTLELFASETTTTPTLDTGSTVRYTGDGDSNADDFGLKDWVYSNLTIAMTDSSDTIGATTSNSLTNGLIGYWPFEEGTGTSTNDEAGSADGTLTSMEAGDWDSSDKAPLDFTNGYSLNFDGSNEFITMPAFSQTLSTITMTAWIKASSFQACDGVVFSRGTGVSGINAGACNDSSRLGYHWDNGNQWDWAGGPTIPTSTWALVAITVNSTTGTAYVYNSGTSSLSSAANSEAHGSSLFDDLKIAVDEFSSRYFTGRIDDVRIYNRVLTADEITDLGEGLDDNSVSIEDVDVNGNFTLSSGIFTAPSGNLTVGGNFTKSGGTFTHNSGTVVLDGGSQAISGSTTFNNLTKNDSSGSTLTFPSSATQTILGTLNLRGNLSFLTLAPSSPTVAWSIDPQGAHDLSCVSVSYSTNIDGDDLVTTGHDGGNNTGWDITETSSCVPASKVQRGVTIQRGTTIRGN